MPKLRHKLIQNGLKVHKNILFDSLQGDFFASFCIMKVVAFFNLLILKNAGKDIFPSQWFCSRAFTKNRKYY